MSKPVIGVTMDVAEPVAGKPRAWVAMTYLRAVAAAGGVPVPLAPAAELIGEQRAMCDGVVFTGGADIRMETLAPGLAAHGQTHTHASPMHEIRQAYEFALLDAIDRRTPVLGVCMGMQEMAVHAGGVIDQHLPEILPTAPQHVGDNLHAIVPVAGVAAVGGGPGLAGGSAASSHHQGVRSAGRLRVIARAMDGVIEAVDDPSRPFYVGVQWHPERTGDHALGLGIFERLIAAAKR